MMMLKKRTSFLWAVAGGLFVFTLCLNAHSTTTQNKGVVLTFHQWPSHESQKKLTKVLKNQGLTLSKSFKDFKVLVFQWSEKTENKGELTSKAQFVCGLLRSYRFLRHCSADSPLVPRQNTHHHPTEASTLCKAGFSCLKTNQNPGTQEEITTLKTKVSSSVCEITPSERELKGGTLSDFWAQELTGADLVREELKNTPALPENYNLVAVFDDFNKGNDEAMLTTDNHGVLVGNLISSEERQAVLPALHPTQINNFEYMSLSASVDTIHLLKNNPPSFINLSLGFHQDPGLLHQDRKSETFLIQNEIFSHLSHSIIIDAAGNQFTKTIPEETTKPPNKIVVGSFSPSGLVSGFSQSGPKVSILAPSDVYLTSLNNEGEYDKFSGTSGAAPLVTGALAAFEWLSGHHPSPEEAKYLLEKTAIPTLESVFENPPRNGAGVLNAYKLARIAKRLRKRCQTNAACFKKEIQKEDLYQFQRNNNLSRQIRMVFPECAKKDKSSPLPRSGVKSFSCNHKKTVLNALRREFLLFPQETGLLNHLACIYKSHGLASNAQMFETLSLTSKGKEEVIKNMESKITTLAQAEEQESKRGKIEIIRFLSNFPTNERAKRVLMQTALDPNPLVKKILAQIAAHNNNPDILNILSKDNDPSLRADVALLQIQKGRLKEGKLLLENLLEEISQQTVPTEYLINGARKQPTGKKQTESPFIDPHLLSQTALILGSEGEWLIEDLAQSPLPHIRAQAVEPALHLSTAQGTRILNLLAQDPDEQVRTQVIKAAEETWGQGAVSALNIIAQSPSKPLRQRIDGMITGYHDFLKTMEGELYTRTMSPADMFQIRQSLLKAGAKYGTLEKHPTVEYEYETSPVEYPAR